MLINKKSIISFCLIKCMLMPKIDLIPIPGYYQGLRYDDLILLTGFIYILLQRKIFLHVFPARNIYFVFYGIILAYGLFSLFEFGFVSIILAVRWLEYSIFFVLLFYSSLNSGQIRKFIITYIFINCIFVLPQYFEKSIFEYTGLQFEYTKIWVDTHGIAEVNPDLGVNILEMTEC